MNEKWFAIYQEKTGDLYSTATVLADEAVLRANGLAVIEVDGQANGRPWNPKTLAFDPLPETKPENTALQEEISQTVMAVLKQRGIS